MRHRISLRSGRAGPVLVVPEDLTDVDLVGRVAETTDMGRVDFPALAEVE